jgi:predicted metal-dependent phosphoesterase TrpH
MENIETLNKSAQLEKRWLKAELHSHCNLDPIDYRFCSYSPEELISHAAKLHYDVLAITCHDIDVWTVDLFDYAQNLGITLIPGMEVTAEGSRHTLVYNFRTGADDLNTLQKIRDLTSKDTLAIAPHPFFPGGSCLGRLIESNFDLFDAIEYSGFHTRHLDFNVRSETIAKRTGKPLIGNGDVHYLWQLGRTYTWIYSEPDIHSIVHAVKNGLVRIQKSPLTLFEVSKWWMTCLWSYGFPINSSPAKQLPSVSHQSDKIKNGRRLGTAQESVEP